MRLLRTFIVAVLLLLALVFAAGWAWLRDDGGWALLVAPERLQAQLQTRFPIRNCALVLACLEFSQPRLGAPPGGDRLQLDTQLAVQMGGRSFPGRASVAARPRYEPATGAVHLGDIVVNDFQLAGMPEPYVALVRRHGPQVIQAALRDRPVYVLDTTTAAGALARRVVRDVRVVNGRIRVGMSPNGS